MSDNASWPSIVAAIGTTAAGFVTACGAVWVGLYRGKAEINVSALSEERIARVRAELEIGRLKEDLRREEDAHGRTKRELGQKYERANDLCLAWQRTASDLAHDGNNLLNRVANLGASALMALPDLPALEDIEQWREEGGVRGHWGTPKTP